MRLAILSVLFCACAAAPAQPEPAPAAVRGGWPAMDWVPAEPSYAVVAARTIDLAGSLRELSAALGLFADVGLAEIDRDLRRALGASFLQADELVAAGIDIDRGAALWSTGLYPTMAVPVRDRQLLAALVERQLPADGISVRRLGAHDLYRLRLDQLALEWVITDDWLLLHLGQRREPMGSWATELMRGPPGGGRAPPADLLDAVTAARSYLAIPGDDTPRVIDARRVRPGVVGVVRIDRLWPHLAPLLPRSAGACRTALAGRGRLLLAADLSWSAGSGMIALELADGAAARLAAALAPPPPPGLAAFRADAGAWVEWGLDPRWPWQVQAQSACRLLPEMPGSIGRLAFGGAVTAGHLVAADTRVSRPDQARAAAHLRLREPADAEKLLGLVPLGRAGPGQTISGVQVNTLEVPILPTIRYRVAGGGLTAALGDGVMEILLGPGPARPRGATVLAAGLSPPRMPELAEDLRVAASLLGVPGHNYFERTTGRVQRWQSGEIRLLLDGRALVLTLAMRLR